MLRTLVLQRADILENKETSTKINAAKKLVWEDVVSWLVLDCNFYNCLHKFHSNGYWKGTTILHFVFNFSFNKVSNNKRDLNQILNQWRNMKNRAKSLPNNRRSSSTSAEVFIPEIDLVCEVLFCKLWVRLCYEGLS